MPIPGKWCRRSRSAITLTLPHSIPMLALLSFQTAMARSTSFARILPTITRYRHHSECSSGEDHDVRFGHQVLYLSIMESEQFERLVVGQ